MSDAKAPNADDQIAAVEPVTASLGASEPPKGLKGQFPAPPPVEIPLSEGPQTVVGRYRLLEKIGEGGFGVVYVAEQKTPVRRRVAMKIIKLGMDTRSVVARFEAERQALAMMDHPNIAKVFDAGATDTGRPYFVMELVRGIPITDYCDQNNLPPVQRLRLFIDVCHAIQHAHQKGVIHRDIKPSNILLTLHDGVPVPKVIDFGIAKATQGDLTDKTIYTQFQQFIGTPAYMSPEQAEMSAMDVDTRSDVYGLGVLLYELLTGTTPFDAKELMKAGMDEMRRKIRETEPVRPSNRLSGMTGQDSTTTAKRRGMESHRLIGLMRGDLDWIVMKCLEKDRGRRYETASGLALDIQRHLNNEPVIARPPSSAYRFRKLVRRNKLAFGAAAVVVLALVLGICVSTWEAVRAKQAEALALQTRANAEKLSNFILDDFYDELEPTAQNDTLTRLARQAVAYYDGLPPSMRTPETARNRAAALARLALYSVAQGDIKTAKPAADEAAATLDHMRQQGDQSEGTIYALALALHTQAGCANLRLDDAAAVGLEKMGLELLRPLALSEDGSRRIKLEYSTLANSFAFTQPPRQRAASYEEALHVLASLGALDLSDLSAASKWADIADSEAREYLSVGEVDDAERLEKQVQRLAEGVLSRRPTDLEARGDLCWAPDGLALVEARRFHDEAALEFATKSHGAAQDYRRFNPSNLEGWGDLALSDCLVSTLSFREGHVAEALQKAQVAIQTDRDPHNSPENVWAMAELDLGVARWEAQRGNRGAADHALQEARQSHDAISAQNGVSEWDQVWAESAEDAQRQIGLAFGEDATVYDMSNDALPRIDKVSEGSINREDRAELLHFKRQALEEAAGAALNLRRYADAQTAAHALLLLPPETVADSEHYFLDQPDDQVWGLVLVAQAEAGQGRNAEAMKTLEPALAHYRELQPQAGSDVFFRQHFARALYVQALAEAADHAGTASARQSLDQADSLLMGLSDEARQLHDSKQLLSWIDAARKKF